MLHHSYLVGQPEPQRCLLPTPRYPPLPLPVLLSALDTFAVVWAVMRIASISHLTFFAAS